MATRGLILLPWTVQESENFLHRSGRTGRAGRSGTAIAMFMPKEYGYFKSIIKQTRVENLEVIAPPAPRQVMESAAKAVRIHPGFVSLQTPNMCMTCDQLQTKLFCPS